MYIVFGNLASGPPTTQEGWLVAVAFLFAASSFGLLHFGASPARGLDTLRTDVRVALRVMAGRPTVTLLAVVSLAIGIGAAVASFNMIDILLVRPLPFHQGERLVDVYGTVVERGWRNTTVSVPDILDLREASSTMEVAAIHRASFNLSGEGRPERIEGRRVSWNFFAVLATRPMLGRAFLPEEEQAGSDNVVVITAGLWHRRFAADPEILGETVQVDGEPHTVIGVLPTEFWFEGRSSELWMPLGTTGEESRSSRDIFSLARLEPGVTVEQARAEAEEIARGLERRFPDSNNGWGMGVRPLRDGVLDSRIRMGSVIAAVAVGLVLLIACGNVANLLLARAAERAREIAVRAALGASRGRLFRQLLVEAVLLAATGGAMGTALSVAGLKACVSLLPGWFPRTEALGVDGRALLFALGMTLLTALIFGTLPALRSAKSNGLPALREGGRGAVLPVGGRLRRALVVGEVALTFTLAVCGALLIQGFARLQGTDWGWNPDGVLTFKVTLPEADYAGDQAVVAFYEQLSAELSSLPGVAAVGGTEILPLEGQSTTFYNIPGEGVVKEPRPVISTRAVLPGYFDAMGITILRGSPMTESRSPDALPAVIINQVLAKRHWPDSDPVGETIRFWRLDHEIVAVVADTLDVRRVARPMGYVSHSHLPLRGMSLVVRGTEGLAPLAASVGDVVARLDPNLPVYDVIAMSRLMAHENAGYSLMPVLMTALTVVGLVLSLIGVYGVVAYAVSLRKGEVGVRMALGAQRRDVLAMVIRQGATLVAIGIVLGVALSALATRNLALFLFGVSPFDVVAFGAVAIALMAAGLLATFVPARRAALVDPACLLRSL